MHFRGKELILFTVYKPQWTLLFTEWTGHLTELVWKRRWNYGQVLNARGDKNAIITTLSQQERRGLKTHPYLTLVLYWMNTAWSIYVTGIISQILSLLWKVDYSSKKPLLDQQSSESYHLLFRTGSPFLKSFCQAQSQLQVKLSLKTELALISTNPATHPPWKMTSNI